MKIAIASGKGGTGKTTVSTNLAAYWAHRRPVFLVDLDVEEPNAALFFGDFNEEPSGAPAGSERPADERPGNKQTKRPLIREKLLIKAVPNWLSENCILCGQCQKLCEFNAVMKIGDEIMVFPELCHSCYACSELCPTSSLPMLERRIGELRHWRIGETGYRQDEKGRTPNLDYIEGRLAVGEEQAVPAIKQTLSYLRLFQQERYAGKTDNSTPIGSTSAGSDSGGIEPIVILDSPPGTSCPVVEVVKNADFVILVTEPTPFGLHDLRLAVDLVQSMGKGFAVVINRDGVGDDEVNRYCADEQIDVMARIPQSRDMAEAYSAGKLLFRDFREMENAVSDIVDFLEERAPVEAS